MARRSAAKLKDVFIQRSRQVGFHSDGHNLYLQIKNATARRWVFRYEMNGKARDIGLGPVDNDTRKPEEDEEGNPVPRPREERITWTTRVVRAKAANWCALLREGADPAEIYRSEQQAERSKQLEEQRQSAPEASVMTFSRACEALLEAKGDGWRNAKHAAQWRTTLTKYACRVTRDRDGAEIAEVIRNPDGSTGTTGLGPMPVAEVTMADVLKALRRDNLWSTKTETADRLRGRIHAVFAWAIAHEHRTAANPADWDRLQHSLVQPGKLKRVRHHPSMPYAMVSAFVAQLGERNGIDAAAMRFVILTAVRTSEALGATWDEIDLGGAMWRIPGERMKLKRAHDVPLSAHALAVLREMDAIRQNSFIFPGMIRGQGLSNMALLMLIKRLGLKGTVTTHGFRASFKTWASEATDFDRMAVEKCLAHEIGNAVEKSYLRGELLGKRKVIMQTWADHCCDGVNVGRVVAE